MIPWILPAVGQNPPGTPLILFLGPQLGLVHLISPVPGPGPGPCPRPGPWARSQARALGPGHWSPHGPWPLGPPWALATGPPLGPGHWSRALGPVRLNTKSSINSPQMAPNEKQGVPQNPKSLLQFASQIDVFFRKGHRKRIHMPSFLACHLGLMSHLESTFSKNDAVRGAGILTFF